MAKELECEVKNLIEGGVYMFRVVAENGMGEGAPLEGSGQPEHFIYRSTNRNNALGEKYFGLAEIIYFGSLSQ